jgi:hypothetical protein
MGNFGRESDEPTNHHVPGAFRLMYGKNAAGVLAHILGHVAFYCIDHELPPLTSIVVGKGRGTPGAEIPINPATVDQQREKVYQYDWYDLYPPSEPDLSAAALAHAAS